MKYRRTIVTVGLGVTVMASATLLASPAQAATTGLARVVDTGTVEFRALMGRVNNVKVTIVGRTVTIDDVAAISAGKGCRRVDSSKVRCTTRGETTEISVALGDRNDHVRNYTGVFMLAGGGAGNDTLIGGPGRDQLQGGAGADKIYGNGGEDELFGQSGADLISGGAGEDYIVAGGGDDRLYGGAGNDEIHGQTGGDTVDAGAGDDTVLGYSGDDRITGGAGIDFLIGNAGDDTLSGGAGDDVLVGEHYKAVGGRGVSKGSATAADRLYADAGTDICLKPSGRTTTSGCEHFTSVASVPAAVASPSRITPLAVG